MKISQIVLFLGLTAACICQARPFINVPQIEGSVTIDQIARPDADFWKKACVLYGLTEFNSQLAPRWNSSVALASDGKNLYVQARAAREIGANLVAAAAKRDGRVYFDDCLEVALALPGAALTDYYQFSLNSANVAFDSFRADPGWNGKWTSTTFVENDRWTATYCIPFSDLGLGKCPKTLNFNVARTNLAPSAEQSVLVRSSSTLFFGNMPEALELRFGKELPSGRYELVEQEESTILRCVAHTLPKEKFVDFIYEIVDKNGKTLSTGKGQSRFDSLQTDIPLARIPDGEHTMRLVMQQPTEFVMPAYYGGGTEANPNLKNGEAPEIYLSWTWPIHVDNAPKLLGEVKLTKEGRKFQLTVEPLNVDFNGEACYRVVILDAEGKNIVMSMGNIDCEGEKQRITTDISDFPERTRFIASVELILDDKSIVSGQYPFATPPKPIWKGKSPDAPDVNKVPAPWTPVQLNRMQAECWGRTFEFSATSPVPTQIVSQNVPLLSSPARLVTTPAIAWKLTKAAKLNPSCARFDYTGSIGTVTISAFSEVYFDGVIRTDIVLPPKLKLSEMYLELPYRKEIAAFVHDGPGQFGGMFNIRLCNQEEKHAYLPNYMLLNDNVGLGWFDAMPFDWPLNDSNKVIVMTPKAEQTTVRINYIDNGKTYAGDRRFSWGLQAFPARPMPKEEVGMRMSYAILYGDENRTAWYSSVDYLPKGNIQLAEGALEFSFKVPSSGMDEPLLRITHGEAEKVDLLVQKDGKFTANSFYYGAWRWKLNSRDGMAPDVWHKVGLNWGDGKIELWLDGKMVSSCERPHLMSIFPSNISIGGIHAVVDDFRISSTPRSAFSAGALTADEQTLLYDNFDQTGYVNGRRATIPQKISEEGEAGYLLPDTELTRGLRGKAVGPMTKPLKSVIQGYAALGFQVMCYHAAQYTDEAFSGLYIKNESAFRKNVKAIHDAGMKAIVYTGNGISNFDRSWNTYADEWLIEPRGVPFVQSWIPDEKGYQACPRSGFTDYFFHRIGRLMDDYGIDGIFLDGRMEAQCANERHGCGIRNFDGKTVAKRDVWTGRMLSWHLYNVVQNRGGYCEQHKSGNWNIPDCFFWNGVWEGEQLMGVQLNGRKRLDVCPLESMRGEINGIPFGMPSRNTAYSYSPLSPVENCTMSFVHGTSWTMTYRMEEGQVVSPYWLAQLKFGACKQNFLPYWAPRPPARNVPNSLVKVSAHVKKGQALIMVANFNEETKRIVGEVALDLGALGIHRPVMKNAFSGEKVAISQNGEFSIDIKSFRQDWFIVEEAK